MHLKASHINYANHINMFLRKSLICLECTSHNTKKTCIQKILRLQMFKTFLPLANVYI